jgi:G3E family GTPase
MVKSVPVYVLNGFLGSGKTTVLINILTYCKQQGLKTGVILNELGETNVEGHLFESEKVVELLNGCICCTIQDDLRATLDELRKGEPLDLLLIEGTGVANPLEIIDALTDPKYNENFDLRSIIGLVDASQYLEFQSIFSSSKEVRTLLQEQIKHSTLLLLNKTDLISQPKLEKIEKLIRKNISEDVPIVRTSFAGVDVDLLLQRRFQTVKLTKTHSGCCNHHEEGESCHHHHHSNHSTIKAIQLTTFSVLNRLTFEKWLKSLPKEIFRGKGIVQIEGESGYYDFQYAFGQLKLTCLQDNHKVSASIVLIGKDFNEEEILHSFTCNLMQASPK